MEVKEIVEEKQDIDIKKPNMYEVMLLNDDYTTMEFVVDILMEVFHKTKQEASYIMLDVHLRGKGVVGIYTYDIAATKVMLVEELARENGFPLKADMCKIE